MPGKPHETAEPGIDEVDQPADDGGGQATSGWTPVLA